MAEAARPRLPVRPAGEGGAVLVPVRVTPRAGRNRIEGVAVDADGTRRLKLSVTAPAEGGRANRAAVALLAKAWKLPKGAFSIAAGARARNKVLRIAGAVPSAWAEIGEGGARGD